MSRPEKLVSLLVIILELTQGERDISDSLCRGNSTWNMNGMETSPEHELSCKTQMSLWLAGMSDEDSKTHAILVSEFHILFWRNLACSRIFCICRVQHSTVFAVLLNALLHLSPSVLGKATPVTQKVLQLLT